jgi:2'-5' RNA ligase
MERDATQRLFVAIELPESVRQALRGAMDLLQRRGLAAGLRWVRPEGIHLTLKFLGATAEPRVPEIAAALRRALAGAPAFGLQPEGFGTFPEIRLDQHATHRGKLRVVWVGIVGDTAALSALAARVEGALAPRGYPEETRPYFAHLTLARVREDASRATVASLCDALQPYLPSSSRSARDQPGLVPVFPAFQVERVALMESKLAPGGAQYRAIETFALDE